MGQDDRAYWMKNLLRASGSLPALMFCDFAESSTIGFFSGRTRRFYSPHFLSCSSPPQVR